ncbi:hypothetical protein KEJ34_03160 [Candidatus Bathyarchaeota archaeon]|nr:hypothetical protein [Candidatus Bathyarchaeota archaeon]
MGAKQLQTIYRLVKTRPLPFVEAYIKRQIGREVRGLNGFLKMLELCQKYVYDKAPLEKILLYANMLYDFFEKQPALKLKAAGEQSIKKVVEGHGLTYDGVSMNLRGRDLEVRVKVKGLHGPPKPLAMEIERVLKGKSEFANLNLRIWIE